MMLTRCVTVLMAVALFAGCDSASEPFDISRYIGTYAGTRTVAAHGDQTPYVEDISITLLADSRTQTVTITLNPEPGAPETLHGHYDEAGIYVEQTGGGVDFTFTVEEGDIHGDGTFNAFGVEGTVEITGLLSSQRFDLISVVTITRGDDLNPVGARSTTTIRTVRL